VWAAQCVPAARTDGSIPRHQCCPLSPPGCLRTRLGIPPSLSWRNTGACKPTGPRNSPPRACLECRCIMSHVASQSRRSARETPSDRSLRGESRRSDGKATTVIPAPILPYSGTFMRLGRPCVVGAVQVAPAPRIRPREVKRYGLFLKILCPLHLQKLAESSHVPGPRTQSYTTRLLPIPLHALPPSARIQARQKPVTSAGALRRHRRLCA
jgi:hypothetical protein